MKKIAILIMAVCVVFSWASVSPIGNSIYILLYDKHSGNSDPYTLTGFKKYLSEQVVSDEGRVYTYGLDVSTDSPNKLANLLANRDANSVYAEALDNWFNKSSDKNLLAWKRNHTHAKFTDLVKDRIDIVPLSFVIIAEGVSGLVVREHIQGINYQGDFAKVLFFDTPHSGTGYADQSLFQSADGYSLSKPNTSSLGALIPMTLLAYYFDGGDSFRNMVISLSKSAILGMASNLGDIEEAFKGDGSTLFKQFSKNSEALWYLAQDADYTDSKYKDMIAKADAAGKDILSNIGGTQWLNSTRMNTDFDQPLYSIAYSYGFPTIGNGRRTFPDFMDQVKNHISKEKIKSAIKDSLKSVLEKNGITKESVEAEVNNLANELVNGVISDEAKKFAADMVAKYDNLKTIFNNENLGNYIQGFSELIKMDKNIDDISDVIKLLNILEKFIPEKYKSQLFTAIIDNFSPEIIEAANCTLTGSMKGCVQKGLTVSATNLANYGINFFDEGTFDVPLYSSYGDNIAAFREASREGFNLAEMVTKNTYPQLYEYKELLEDVGKLEVARQDVDIALGITCAALIDPFKDVCKAAAFATNVVMIGDLSLKTSKLASKINVLKDTKYMSLVGSMHPKSVPYTYTFMNAEDGSESIAYSGIDAMIFEKPEIAIASVRRTGTVDSIVPLMLYGTCNGDVYDFNTLEKHCTVAPSDNPKKEEPEPLFGASIPVKELTKSNQEVLSIHDVVIETSPNDIPSRNQNSWKWKAFRAQKPIYEYRFIINDFQPDSLHKIAFDFNGKIQLSIERHGSVWNVYRSSGSKGWVSYGQLNNPPVDKNGLFIFRPKDILNMDPDKSIPHVITEIQNEGPNMVTMSVINKLGMTAYIQFSYFYQSTPTLLEEGWPKSFDILSQLNQVFVKYHNLENPVTPIVEGSNLKLFKFKFGENGEGREIGSAPIVVEQEEERYKISADLSTLWEQTTKESGEYLLKWTINEIDEQGKISPNTIQSLVYVDRTLPTIEIALNKNILKGTYADGAWGTIVNKDPEKDRAIRAMRGFIVDEKSSDTIIIKHISGINEHYIDFAWGAQLPSYQGKAKVVFQAYDYAMASIDMEKTLETVKLDSGRSSWKEVLNGSIFKEGINGDTVETYVWIDGVAPKIADGSLKIESQKKTISSDRPTFTPTMADKHLGALDSLEITYNIFEPLNGRDSSLIHTQIFFDDDKNNIHATYVREAVVKTDISSFEFVEPEKDKLIDGIYQVTVVMTDEAGNESRNVICKKLIVDRTAPIVAELVNEDVSYATISEVNTAKAYVSQIADLEGNRSELKCYTKVNANGTSGTWNFVGEEKNSVNGNDNVPFEFKLSEYVKYISKGLLTIRFGCFDAVGNYGENVNFFGVGKRYPRITYPVNGEGDSYGGKVLIEGTTPNPIAKNGDDNNATFAIEWKKISSPDYSSDKVAHLTETISEQKKSLAIWDASDLERGDYDIRLTVSGCDYTGSVCDTSIVEKRVTLGDNIDENGIPRNEETLPKLTMLPISGKLIPGIMNKIQLKLEGGDTSSWSMNVSIEVQSPKDPNVYSVAKSVYFNTVIKSPFDDKPAVFEDGLSVWQEAGVWNVHWKGAAESRSEGSVPYLILRYQKDFMNFTSDSDVSTVEENVVAMRPIDLGPYAIPGYDMQKKWELKGNDVTIQFKADSAFILDVASVKDAEKMIFCGGQSIAANEVISSSYNSPTLIVNPQQYLVNIEWDGLTQEKLYPSGTTVKMHAYAYQKNNKSRLISYDNSLELATEELAIVPGENKTYKFYVGIGDEVEDGNEGKAKALAQSDFGFEFGIRGKSADVTAQIFDSNGKLVKTLMNKKHLLAGTANSAYNVSWNGMSDVGFASIEEGSYKLVITAQSGEQNATLTHTFEVLYPDNLIEAPTEGFKPGEYPAELTMDEAFEDENKELRYTSKPDYLLEALLSAKTLPKEQRVVDYQWSIEGTQFPVFYKKNRFSVGVRRHRRQFDVVVGILLAARGRDIYRYSTGEEGISYKIQLIPMTFVEGQSTPHTIQLDPWHEVVSWDTWTDDGKVKSEFLPIGMQIKVFDKNNLVLHNPGISLSDYNLNGHISTKNWTEGLWKNTDKNNDLESWLQNFSGSTVYWASAPLDFFGNTNTLSFANNKVSDITPCNASQIYSENSNETYECKVDDYDAHINMLTITANPLPGKSEFHFGNYSCKDEYLLCDNEHHGAKEDVGMTLTFTVNPDYWNPKFGWSNLANAYTRFDPANTGLYGNEGYMRTIGEEKNFFDKSVGWKHDESVNHYITAFEAHKLPIKCVSGRESANPLLFGDEAGCSSPYSPSDFEAYFFNDPENTRYKLGIYRTIGSENMVQYVHLISDAGGMAKMENVPDPTKVAIYVAPMLKPTEGMVSYKEISTSYPFSGTAEAYSDIEDKVSKRCEFIRGCEFYKGFASRLHLSVGDWDDDKWDANFLTDDGYLANPLIFSHDPSIGWHPLYIDEPLNVPNALLEKKSYPVMDTDVNEKGEWQIPSSILKEPAKDKSRYFEANAPTGDFQLSILTDGWKPVRIEKGTTENEKWTAINAGMDTTSVVSYILSKDKSQTSNKAASTHKIPFENLKSQNLENGIFSDKYKQNIKVTTYALYERDSNEDGIKLDDVGEKQKHPYFTINFENNNFAVTRGNINYENRESEIATLRGCVPGANSKWSLMYTKNGMLYPLADGTQEKVPTEAPYPVLDYAELNKLQGNTSFFLTYGGNNGTTYFRQLDVHIGDLVKHNKNAIVQSMYGNVTVDFNAGVWGESDVDVTVRTVPKGGEYNLTAFKNLEIVGPVVEILPSHDFSSEKSENWPKISVTLLRKDIPKGTDPKKLKIYKPDYKTNEIIALETQIPEPLNDDNAPVDWDDLWTKIKITAKTGTFSTFIVMDPEIAQTVVPNDGSDTEEKTLVCTEYAIETIWAGTDNGWLEYPYLCSGKSNYLLQIRSDSDVIAEHQSASTNPIVWELRNSDLYSKKDSYSSRMVFYGIDGKMEQFVGPMVNIDAFAPKIDDIEVDIKDDRTNKLVEIKPYLSDVGSGIAKTKFDLYLGGNLIKTSTIIGDNTPMETFVVERKLLNTCIGCEAKVAITTEDFGHNHVKATHTIKALYPYPNSLVLWYPLSDGAGKYAREMTGNNMDLDLSKAARPWLNGKRLFIKTTDYAMPANSLPQAEEEFPLSIEITSNMSYRAGSLLTWSGKVQWTIGIEENDGKFYYYIKNSSGKTIFTPKAEARKDEHIVITIEGKKASFYRNGELLDVKTLPSSIVWIGSGRPRVGQIGSTQSMSGYIENIRIYNSALTAEQVSSLYHDDLGLDEKEIITARAVTLPHEGLTIDQSCGVAGKAYLRQKKTSSSSGVMTWNVDVDAGNYDLYLLMMNPINDNALAEIIVNGKSYGVVKMKSTGFWDSQHVGNFSISLVSGANEIRIRPIGNMGVAAVALGNSLNDLPADVIDYGVASWKNPEPRASVMMSYNSPNDKTWMRAQFQVKNLTEEKIEHARLRYYYRGEGADIGTQVFNPYNSYMSVVQDAEDVYYGEFTFEQIIGSYETIYNMPFFGMHRNLYFEPWNIEDDPSYIESAKTNFVEAKGVALLDEEGNLLNDWACYDSDGPVELAKKEIRVLASDEKFGSDISSTIKLVVENVGKLPLDGFEVRYYFRDTSDSVDVSVYDSQGASISKVAVGGNLNYVSAIYSDTKLNPGELSNYGNGVKFELHYPSWSKGFSAGDDPSHYNINGWEQVEADSVVLLDLKGNLLWGNVPRPEFSDDYIVSQSNESIIFRDGDIIYIEIENAGSYTLEIVNAVGIPLKTLFSGSWGIGEHMIDASAYSINAGCYLVLRKDKAILYWQLFK